MGGGGVRLIFCPSFRLSGLYPEDILLTAQRFVTKPGVVVHHHESECDV